MKHNEDPDSPRSSLAPTSAALHSKQRAQSPGYHSNSDYRPPVVSHHITNTYTQMVRRGGCTVHTHENTVHTNLSVVIHILVQICVHAWAHAQWQINVLAIGTILSLFCWCLSAKCFSLFRGSSSASSFVQTCLLKRVEKVILRFNGKT